MIVTARLHQARWASLAGLVVLAVVLTRTAWVCDDAYITFRTVANLLHGDGARWNVAERVQAYTHPLWMLMLAALELVTREPYFTSIAASLTLSLAAASLVAYRIAHTGWQGCLAVLTLVSAKSFVDFSTSGLENPLSHLLIAAYIVARSDGASFESGTRPTRGIRWTRTSCSYRRNVEPRTAPRAPTIHLVKNAPTVRRSDDASAMPFC